MMALGMGLLTFWVSDTHSESHVYLKMSRLYPKILFLAPPCSQIFTFVEVVYD